MSPRSAGPPDPSSYRSIEFTGRAPHVRTQLDVPTVMRCVVMSTLPCVAMALYNTGYQANLALAAGAVRSPGWRDLVLQVLAPGQSPTRVWDCLVQGATYFIPLLAVSLASFTLRWPELPSTLAFSSSRSTELGLSRLSHPRLRVAVRRA